MTNEEKNIIARFFIDILIKCLTEKTDTANMHFDSNGVSFDTEITFTHVEVKELS